MDLTGADPVGYWLLPAGPGKALRLASLQREEPAEGLAGLMDLSRHNVLKR